ncbi:AI-2E family transporter [Novispirillum itersonii]|uniref:Putative PurR-regulated permease PerM n=1 Tax=Novispirillum itersonii TaxID=189 RepID=A0A7X0DN80_NOVIT|nr:AI-2E family transporter [Novispirillum itersonii]MBB6211863.1 putative PurR-regulated permease PerM [Novispirillum itersonii]
MTAPSPASPDPTDPDSPLPSPLPSIERHALFWASVIIGTLIGVYLLRSVLLPFVAGAAVAYFLDPVADVLERRGLSRTLATATITALFLLLVAGVLLVLAPAIESQVVGFLHRVPDYLHAIEDRIAPLWAQAAKILPKAQIQSLTDSAKGMIGQGASWFLGLIGKVLTSGLALVNLLSLLVIAPVVSFYLLRDWDRIVSQIDSLLPRRHAGTIRTLAAEADSVLAGFVRGQATVCLALGTFYAVGLTLVGLDLGLVVGLSAGLISFIPYVGTVLGFVVSMGLALAQFSDTLPIVLVGAVFVSGQFLEGNFLSPWLVGERVGLHPVWMIFALLSGGTLFGFVGILLAVPVAAVIGVLVRHFLKRYRDSAYYHGGRSPETHEGPENDDGVEAAGG